MAETPDLNSKRTLRCENHFYVLISKLQNLLAHKKFVDVTLIVEDQLIKAHRIILIAFSEYFEDHVSNQLDDNTPSEVTLQGVRADSMKALIQYMYTGEVTVPRDQLPLLLETATFLKMEGFDMGAQEEDVSISQMFSISTEPNHYWEANDIKKETDGPDKVDAVESSNGNRELVVYPQIPRTTIKEELMEIEEQSQETNDDEELQLDSVGIVNHFPIPISFKRRYSFDEEIAGADDAAINAEIAEQSHQTTQSTEHDGRSEISLHSLNNYGDIGSITDSLDGNIRVSPMVASSQPRENERATPCQKKSYSKVRKTFHERPFKCTNDCGRSYKEKKNLNLHLKYECGTEPRFLCTQCEKRFALKGNLRRHLTNIHKIGRSQHASFITGQKSRPIYDFKWDRCEQKESTYKRKGHLVRHRDKECGVEPSFTCTHCDYWTSQKSYLKAHITNIHG